MTKSISSKTISFIIIAVMMVTTIISTSSVSYAAMTSIPTATQTESVSSSNSVKDEFYKITTPFDEDHTIYVEGKTKIKTKRFCIRVKKHGASGWVITIFVTPDENGDFSIKIDTSEGNTNVPAVLDNKGEVAQIEDSYGTCPGYIPMKKMTSGTYHITIARATTDEDADISRGTKWWEGTLGGNDGYAYHEALLLVNKNDPNNPKVAKYSSVIKNNTNTSNLYEKNSSHDDSYAGSYVRYLDPYMEDMSFVFKNPKTGKYSYMTKDRVAYLQSVSDKITENASSDYEKMYKIYDYVISDFYYDSYAFKKGKYQYSNPYLNIYNHENKISSANSSKGKVATTCQGYAALIIALARAEGIPARYAYGRHISQPITLWSDITVSQIKTRDHWWAEVWVDGRWIIIDANAGGSNKWKRTSFSSAGTWEKGRELSYFYFDPSPEMLSTSYAYTGIYPGATDGKYINNKQEISQLRKLLNAKYYGKTNGKRLNSKYSSTKFSTWHTGKSSTLQTDGYGHVTHLLWSDKKMYGHMNLEGFSKLQYLTIYNNKLSKLTLTKCSSLKYISASYNRFSKFDSTASKKTTFINLKGNKLTSAKFYNGSKKITIARGTAAGGTFGFKYDKSKTKKLTIYASDAKKGYKYLGIYSSSGKKLTSKQTYTFNPGGTKYYVKYKKK